MPSLPAETMNPNIEAAQSSQPPAFHAESRTLNVQPSPQTLFLDFEAKGMCRCRPSWPSVAGPDEGSGWGRGHGSGGDWAPERVQVQSVGSGILRIRGLGILGGSIWRDARVFVGFLELAG